MHFSHRVHMRDGASCEACHANVLADNGRTTTMLTGGERSNTTPHTHLPTMDQCMACHANGGAPAPKDPAQTTDAVTGASPGDWKSTDRRVSTTCSTCHLVDRDGLLQTTFDSGTLAPTGRWRDDDHRFDFASHHGATAAADPRYCESCHTPSSCDACHNAVVRPMALHPAGYDLTHGIDASLDPDSCSSCHTSQDFCVACHEQTLVGEVHQRPLGLDYHPEGFVDEPGSASFHGDEASRNIQACVSCHHESTCVRCHAAINPHPIDFSDRCGAMLERNANACTHCHGQDAKTRLQGRCR